MAETKELRALFGAQTKQLEEAFRRINRETNKYKKSTSGLGAGVKKLAGALAGLLIVRKIARTFISAAQQFREFQKGLAEVATLTKLNTKQMRAMGDETLKVSRTFGQSIQVLTKARYDIVSAGFSDITEQTKLLTAANKVAVAGVTDVATATDLLTSVLNSYGLSADDATQVSDDLFTTVRLGKTTITELAAGLGKVLPIAKAAGVDFNEVGAAMATLTFGGIKTAEAVTSLNQAIVQLSAPTKQAQKELQRMGIQTTDLNGKMLPLQKVIGQFKGKTLAEVRKAIPDVTAAKAILALANNFEVLQSNTEAFADSAGATEEAFETMAGTLDFELNKLQQAIKATFIETFRGEAGTAVGEAVGEMNAFFEENAEQIKGVTQAIGELVAVGIKGGLIPAMMLAIDAFQRWGALMQVNEQGTSRLTAEFRLFFEEFKDGNDAILTSFGKTVDGWLAGLSEMLTGSRSTLDDIGVSFQSVFNTMKSIYTGFIDGIIGAFKRMADNFKTVVMFLPNLMISAWKLIKKVIDEGAPGLWNAIKTSFDAIIAGIRAKFAALVNFFVKKINGLIAKANSVPGVSIAPVATLAKGGQVRRFQAGGPVGTDTVPALLTPGEIVINRKTAQANKEALLALNAGKFAKGGVVGMQEGGMISSPTGSPAVAGGVSGTFPEFEAMILEFSQNIQDLIVQSMTETEQLAFERAQALMEIQAIPFSEDQRSLMEGLINDFYGLQAEAIRQSEVEKAAKEKAQNVIFWSNKMFDGLEQAGTAILTGQKSFGQAFAQLGIEFTKDLIRQAAKNLIAKKIEQIALATIEAPGTFGASLVKIAPIVAATAAGLAALSALGASVGGAGGATAGTSTPTGAPTAGPGFGGVTPGFGPEETVGGPGGITINVTVQGNVVDSQAFVEETVAPVLADAIGRGTLAGSEFNLVVEKD